MNNFIKKIKFYLERYLFEKWAFPIVKNDKISKIIFKQYLPKKSIIVDCGAHDGADTLALAETLQCSIHAFEPVQAIFLRLKTNTAKLSNVTCYQIALSNQNGEQTFYVSEGGSDGSSSLLEPKDHLTDHPDTFFNSHVLVSCLTLDTWAEKYNVEFVDLLWLDMQGFELDMLKASKKILPTVKAIHTEVSTKETYKGVPLYSVLRQYLESKGFKVAVEAIPPGADMGNVFFVRS